MAARIRVYELARELGLTNKETLDLCSALGIGVKSHSSSIEDAQADRVRRKAEREGLKRDVQPEEPGAKPAAPARAGASGPGATPPHAGSPAPGSRAPGPSSPGAPAPGSAGQPDAPSRLVTSRPASRDGASG